MYMNMNSHIRNYIGHYNTQKKDIEKERKKENEDVCMQLYIHKHRCTLQY